MRRTNHRNLVNVGILSGRIPLISLVQFTYRKLKNQSIPLSTPYAT